MEAEKIKEYTGQFVVNIVGLLTVALLLFAINVFRPYIQPFIMAAVFSIPLGALHREWNKLTACTLKKKARTIFSIWFLLLIIFLSTICLSLLGPVAGGGLIIICTAVFANMPKLTPNQFIIFLFFCLIGSLALVLVKSFEEVLRVGGILAHWNESSELELLIHSAFQQFDKFFTDYFGQGALEWTQSTLELFGITSTESGLLNERDKIKTILQNIAEIQNLYSVKSILQYFSSKVSSVHVVSVSRLVLGLIFSLLSFILRSADLLVQTFTFLALLSHFVGKKRNTLEYLVKFVHPAGEFSGPINDMQASLAVITWKFVKRLSLETSGSYFLYMIFGCKLSTIWALFSGVLIIVPIAHPSFSALLPLAELLLSNRKIAGMILLALHILYNVFWVPRVEIPFIGDNGTKSILITNRVRVFGRYCRPRGVVDFRAHGYCFRSCSCNNPYNYLSKPHQIL